MMRLSPRTSGRRVSRLTAGAAGVVAALLALAPVAHAEFGVEPGSFVAKVHPTVAMLTIGGAQDEFASREIDLAQIVGATPVTQAGAHPDASVSFVLEHTGTGVASKLGEVVKDVTVNTPAGLIGDPNAVPACSREAFQRTYRVSVNEEPLADGCPPASQVGVATVHQGGGSVVARFTSAVYRITTANGKPASFGFAVDGNGIVIDPTIRSGGDYGLTVSTTDIDEEPFPLVDATVTLWGVPASPAHDAERFDNETREWGVALSSAEIKPFLSTPTWCESGSLMTSLRMDSWNEVGRFVPENPLDPNYLAQSPQPTGCEALRFGGPGAEASLTFQPAKHTADTPSGYEAQLTLPYNESPEGFANPTLRDTTVTLPGGVVLDPAGANGLGACSEQQIGYVGSGFPLPRPLRFTGEPAQCPDDSKIGTVEVHTPLLSHPLKGEVYVAAERENPFGSLLAIYITVYDPETGIVVKLAGKVEPDPQTGRLTATFTDNPQLPFTELDVSFFGGAQASLQTPAACGTYTTSSLLTPWSAPQTPAVTSTDTFKVQSGPGGSACVTGEAQQPNSPFFEAGTVNPAAGAYSPFALRLARQDGTQRLKAIDVTLPPGLAGKIAGIEECSDAAIAQARSREGVLGAGALEQSSPSCPAGSLLGTASVTAGAGPDPYPVTGNAYFAGPYDGAPFSVVIVTPAVAGPFDLGTVVVRSGLSIDPKTAQVTVKSDPIPSILDGVPLDVRSIDVDMSRSQFTFNPTSCAPTSVNGSVESPTGSRAAVSDRFQVGGCGSLRFRPSFSALIHARHTRKYGEYLHVVVTSGQGQANIAKVHVTLPKALPSRLSTLNHACPAATFAQDPAGCPSGSFVGTATAYTPVLSTPLTGPAIFVSHGAAGFPDLDVVLQGEGITIDLAGTTDIVKGITTSTFASVPDVPVSRFDLVLPAGEHSALAAEGNLCARTVTTLVKRRVHGKALYRKRRVKKRLTLTMPTTITGQNDAVVEQKTKVAVQGCGGRVRHVRRARRQKTRK
jgi:hypothetical protein